MTEQADQNGDQITNRNSHNQNDSGNQLIGNQIGGDVNINQNYYAAPESSPKVWDGSEPIHQMPPENPSFVGREAILEALNSRVQTDNRSVLTQAIVGLGGVGKSQIATAYAHTHKPTYPLIYWLTADPETSLLDGLRQLGRRLKLPVDNLPDISEAVSLVLGFLVQTEHRWLLIIDNADEIEPRRLRQYLPSSGNGTVLITSRNPNWQGVVAANQVHPVGLFTPEEAVAYLEQELQGHQTSEVLKTSEVSQYTALAEALGYLPLALTHAAGYMTARGQTCADYLRLFNSHQANLLKRHDAPNDYHATIMSTWQIAFEAIEATAGATDILYLCSCLAPDNIPLSLLDSLAELREDSPLADELQREDALAALRRYSLITFGDNTLNMHRLVQLVVLDGLNNLTEWLEKIANLLLKAYPFERHDMSTWPASTALSPHLRAFADLNVTKHFAHAHIARVNNAIGYYLNEFVSPHVAWPYYERAAEMYKIEFGVEDKFTATSLNNLGELSRAMGHYEQARKYNEQALKIRKSIFGTYHLDTLNSLSNQALILNDMREFEEALSYFEKALEVAKNIETELLFIAVILNNLGLLLNNMGNYAKALPHFKQSLEIKISELGLEHQDTAITLNNLGLLLNNMENYEAALPYSQKALAIGERIHGKEHPHVASYSYNLALIHANIGNIIEARPYFERALAIFEAKLGADHLNTQTVRENLNLLLNELNS